MLSTTLNGEEGLAGAQSLFKPTKPPLGLGGHPHSPPHAPPAHSWKPITDYVDQQFEQYFRDESGLNRKNIQDNRVHCCLYFISPFGHGCVTVLGLGAIHLHGAEPHSCLHRHPPPTLSPPLPPLPHRHPYQPLTTPAAPPGFDQWTWVS